MIGRQFTRWFVLSRGEDYIYPSTGKTAERYTCECMCGKIKLVHRSHLLNGTSQSCGCLNREICTKHGMSKTRSYKAWSNMKIRCDNPKSNEETYRQRGVTYQESWEDFEEFYKDMGDCPDCFEIERKDSLLGYTKENCVWADEVTQATNRTRFKNNTSGHTGVTWSEQHGKWRAGIHVNRCRYEGGLYSDFESAVQARKLLEIKHLGHLKENM